MLQYRSSDGHPLTYDQEGAMKRTRGIFGDAEDVRRAVEDLLGNSVPADEIRVLVADEAMSEDREIPVNDEPGAGRGLLLGALGGAFLGAVAALGAVSVYQSPSVLVTLGGLQWVLIGAVVGALGGIPLGGVIGLGSWRRGAERVRASQSPHDQVIVEVHSDALAEKAIRILREAGAERVSTSR
jgi:hypothetical protein